MLRLRSDLVKLCLAALDGRLDKVDAEWDERAALGVVLAAGGYPADYRKGDVITGLPEAGSTDCKVFHAGTREQDGNIVTSGGRVLCVCALGESLAAAQARAYACAANIHWQDVYYRTDIGQRAMGYER
jgi:phosphoribosylamine--glycine ligase